MKLELIEQSGKGINTIVNHYGVGVFNFTNNYLQVNLPYNKNAMAKNEPVKEPVNNMEIKNNRLQLSRSALKVLEMLKGNANYTIDYLAIELGLSRETIKRSLKQLRTKGIVEMVGSDKTCYWKIIE